MNNAKYFECGNMTDLESRKIMEAAAQTNAKNGYGSVTEKWHFSWSRSSNCSSVSSLFFLWCGWQRHVIVPCFPTFLDMGIVWALNRYAVNCCNGDLLPVKCGLRASNSSGKINIMATLWRRVDAPDTCRSREISGLRWIDSCLDFPDWVGPGQH